MPIRRDKLANLLKDSAFRAQFASDQPGEFLPLQIKRLRERHGWTQSELAERAGTQQVVVSRWENPDNRGITLNTLKRLARAFDVALMVRFAPFSEFIDWVCTLSARSFEPASFDEEASTWQYGAAQEMPSQAPLLPDLMAYGTAAEPVANIIAFDPYLRTRRELATGMQLATPPEGATQHAIA
jgi:transcriptional regulator with XRE-family HTH domain